MAIEFHSSGGSFDERRQRAHSYAANLLADRQDLNSTLNILVEDCCMIVFVCNSSGTKEVSIKESDCPSVLYAIVKYLHEGQLNTCAHDIDRTMSADNGPALIYPINETNLHRYMWSRSRQWSIYIHQQGAYPAVVWAGFFDRHSTSAGRSKARIGLLDKGTSFMDIDTPRKVLDAFYDLEGEQRGFLAFIGGLNYM